MVVEGAVVGHCWGSAEGPGLSAPREGLGVGCRWAWWLGLSCAACHLQGKCGLEVGQHVDILGGQRSRSSSQ